MDHGPNVKVDEHVDLVKYKTKVGIILFAVYTVVYSIFVLINTISPKAMEVAVMLGLNLAVFYGFFLIILAVIMGLVYNSICTKIEKKFSKEKGDAK
ncbi:MAG: DUF485 domain-containing protein [Spirochaetales bacterium]|nr:DUF485 domain-containing protein [Spirochaetales bacterium]